MTKNLYIIIAALGFLALQSCSYTKLVPDYQSLLWKNKIYVNGKEGAPSEAENILKQQPNNKFLVGFARPELAFYNWGNGKEGNLFTKIGEKPVIIDSTRVAAGATQLQDWYFNKGYFNAVSTYQIDSIGKQKAKASYYVTTNNRYQINQITYQSRTKELESLVSEVLAKDSLIKKGDPYDAALLEKLRTNIAQLARNTGYFGFSKNYIRYDADTFLVGDMVNIKLIIDQANVEVGDSSYTQNHQQYYIKNIFILPDYRYGDSMAGKDTITESGYTYVYDSLRYRPRYLSDAVHLETGNRYNEDNVKETYSHIVSYKAFQLSDITFSPSGTADALGHPYLNGYINLTPLTKNSLNLEPEFTTSAGTSFGVNGTVGWTIRNLFKGGEALTINLNSGFELTANPGTDNTRSLAFELGTEAILEFPRFLLPFNTQGILPKRMRPASEIGLYYSILNRQQFKRQTFGSRLSYTWKESGRKAHKVDLVDITYSRVSSIEPSFEEQLTDIQRQAFTSEFISATRYTYTFNENLTTKRKNPRYFKGLIEVAGNTMNLLDNIDGVGEINEGNGATTIFNVQYFQYSKFEVDGRYHWNIGKKQSWVQRVYSGYILPYGNSKIATDTGVARVPPFSKYLYMGGSNDMRAWVAYRLGAGTEYNTNYSTGTDNTFATGTFKLLLQSEYRFPIVSYLQGALFLDAGNIWLTGGLQNEQTDLKLDDFYRQLAVGGGVGFRLDFDFFVIRFDIGMKLRDPALLDSNEQWVFLTQPNFVRNWTYNFALGYPF